MPNTDAALRLAIAYVWINEGTYDKEYVATHAYGFDKFEEYTGGRTVDEWVRHGFENSRVNALTTWEEFEEKGYFVVPTEPDWEKRPRGLQKFYKDPDNNPLKTPSGKIEFFSQNIDKHFPHDKERPYHAGAGLRLERVMDR